MVSADLSQLDDSARRILAVASSIADQQMAPRISWRHVLAGAMYLAPAFEAGLRALSVSRESVLGNPIQLVGEPAEVLRIGTSTPMPLSAEVASAIANSDGTAGSLVRKTLSGSRDEVIRLVGTARRFAHVLQTLRDLDSWVEEQQRANRQFEARTDSRPVGEVVVLRELPEDGPK